MRISSWSSWVEPISSRWRIQVVRIIDPLDDRSAAAEAIIPISECLQRLLTVGRIREGPGVAFLQIDPQLRSRGDRPDLHLASRVRMTRQAGKNREHIAMRRDQAEFRGSATIPLHGGDVQDRIVRNDEEIRESIRGFLPSSLPPGGDGPSNRAGARIRLELTVRQLHRRGDARGVSDWESRRTRTAVRFATRGPAGRSSPRTRPRPIAIRTALDRTGPRRSGPRIRRCRPRLRVRGPLGDDHDAWACPDLLGDRSRSG